VQRQAASGVVASGSGARASREVGIGEFGPQERERVMELLLSQVSASSRCSTSAPSREEIRRTEET